MDRAVEAVGFVYNEVFDHKIKNAHNASATNLVFVDNQNTMI